MFGHYVQKSTTQVEPGYAVDTFGEDVVVHLDVSTYICRDGLRLRNLPLLAGTDLGVQGQASYNSYPLSDFRTTYHRSTFNGMPSLDTNNNQKLQFNCDAAFDSDWTMAFTVHMPNALTTSTRDIANFVYNDTNSQSYVRVRPAETNLNVSKDGDSVSLTIGPIGTTATFIASVTGTGVRLTMQSLDGDLTVSTDNATTAVPFHMSSQSPSQDVFMLGSPLSTGPDSTDFRFGEAMLLKKGVTIPEEAALLQYLESKWGA